MQVRRGFLGWGVFLILAGAVPLAVRAGYISDEVIGQFWTLWPLILIGIGVGLILSRTRFDFLGGLIVAATFGIMVGGALSVGVAGVSSASCGGTDEGAAFPPRDGTFVTDGQVSMHLDRGDLTVGVAEGSAWHLEGSDAEGTGPDVEAAASSLDIRSGDSSGGPFFGGDCDTWRVTLPSAPRLELALEPNAGSAIVDLDGATLGTVKLRMNAGSTTMDLGSVAAIRDVDLQLNAGSLGLTLPNTSMTGAIQANAGSVRLCAPEGAALRLHTGDSIVASYDYDGHGLVQDGSTWTTPGFDSAAVKIELETRANAGSFTLDPEDGCE